MPRYFFILDDEQQIDDRTGTVLVDDEAARYHAHQIIAELQADSSFADYRGQMIVTRDGSEIFRIPFAPDAGRPR